MEKQVQEIKNAFNANREANLKALLSCGSTAADKKAYAAAAMMWMISEAGIKEAFRINGYSYAFENMDNEQMIELCESASAEVMDTFCPVEAAEAAKEGQAFEHGKFISRQKGLNIWNS